MKKIILSILSLSMLSMSAFAQTAAPATPQSDRLKTEEQRLESLTAKQAILIAILPDALKSRDGKATIPHTYKFSQVEGGVVIVGASGIILGYISAITFGPILKDSVRMKKSLVVMLASFGVAAVSGIATAVSVSNSDPSFTLNFDRESAPKINAKIAQLSAQISAEKAVIAVINSEIQSSN